MSDFRTIIVPYDFSAHARAALFTAVDLAKRLNADLNVIHVIHAIPPPSYGFGVGGAPVAPPIDTTVIREQVMKSLEDLAGGIRDFPGKIELHALEGAAVANVICESAEDLGADLIVMGTHGRTGLAHVFLGSVAERTLRGAPCPVLTVQSPEEEETE